MGARLHLSFIDEAGTGQVLNEAVADSPPVLVIGGFCLDQARLPDLCDDFLKLKRELEPTIARRRRTIDVIHHEIKGETVRKRFRQGSHRNVRTGHRILGRLLSLLEEHDCQVQARIWVKREGFRYQEKALYSASVLALCTDFERILADRGDLGITVLDSRTKSKNEVSVDAVTRLRFHGSKANLLPHFAESPLFGHSDTHLALQLADLLVSGILFPAACSTYAADLDWNIHCHPGHAQALRHCARLGRLQHRYRDERGRWRGGIVVSDHRSGRSGGDLFREPGEDRRTTAPLDGPADGQLSFFPLQESGSPEQPVEARSPEPDRTRPVDATGGAPRSPGRAGKATAD